ncbi:MAG TPA: hypothetical protein VNJ51_12425 [Candidatus Dormibacteraeota bacterium]|nr:hypothetical protein [Candidatus Dormibacteraeota bacterium]
MRTLHVTRYVGCPFSATIELAELALRDRRDLIVSAAPALRERASVSFRRVKDRDDQTRRHDALLLAWRPHHMTLFPDFHGVLTVRPKHQGVWLRIQGSYEPPLGLCGRVFDALLGRAIARLTLKRLAADLAVKIEARWAAIRSGSKDVSG